MTYKGYEAVVEFDEEARCLSGEVINTHVAPTNSVASAPSTPSCSEPAIGWPPTNR